MKNRKNIDTSTSKELPVSISKDTTTKASLSGIGDGVKNHLGIELSMLPKDVFRNPEYRADLLRFPAKGSVVYHFDGISALIGRDIFRTLLFGLPLESYQLIMEIKDLDDVNSDKNRDVIMHYGVHFYRGAVVSAIKNLVAEAGIKHGPLLTAIENEGLDDFIEDEDLHLEATYPEIDPELAELIVHGSPPPRPAILMDQPCYRLQDIEDWLLGLLRKTER